MNQECDTRYAAWQFFKDYVSYSCFCVKIRKCYGFRAIGIGEAELLPSGKILVRLVPKYSETAKKRMS